MPKKKAVSTHGAILGFEAELWDAADSLRGSMDAAEYKHVVLALILSKFISDAFGDPYATLIAERALGADAENPDEYRAVSVSWMPPAAHRARAQASHFATFQIVGQVINTPRKRQSYDKGRVGEESRQRGFAIPRQAASDHRLRRVRISQVTATRVVWIGS